MISSVCVVKAWWKQACHTSGVTRTLSNIFWEMILIVETHNTWIWEQEMAIWKNFHGHDKCCSNEMTLWTTSLHPITSIQNRFKSKEENLFILRIKLLLYRLWCSTHLNRHFNCIFANHPFLRPWVSCLIILCKQPDQVSSRSNEQFSNNF